ncbi:WXG100 family type VII secretion target [Streptomyces sp. NBC_01190]|jgi:WXG100 family type VII secretion target|uniref:WXG100 family type VII secretion target n=1 Tax=Streptomyces sp. NBC_01190 TaxID=2903767 RepID=UPI00386C8C44|nr:WXG100 family type VII secretion target [Streptomyces sp. NBC_01190]
MAIQGADIQQLRDLSNKFKSEAGNLSTLIGHLQSATSSSDGYWKGPAADRFRSEWSQLKPTFDKFVQTLHDAEKSASTSADNVEAATR